MIVVVVFAGLLPDLLQSYLRGAEEVLPLHVFKCECWKAKSGAQGETASLPADCVLPFGKSPFFLLLLFLLLLMLGMECGV